MTYTWYSKNSLGNRFRLQTPSLANSLQTQKQNNRWKWKAAE